MQSSASKKSEMPSAALSQFWNKKSSKRLWRSASVKKLLYSSSAAQIVLSSTACSMRSLRFCSSVSSGSSSDVSSSGVCSSEGFSASSGFSGVLSGFSGVTSGCSSFVGFSSGLVWFSSCSVCPCSGWAGVSLFFVQPAKSDAAIVSARSSAIHLLFMSVLLSDFH